MSLIIPNATDTTSGNKYQALDQAEPDALDFEILGNTGSSGVLSGGDVTSSGSASTVNVAAAIIILNGTPYAVAGSTPFSLPVAPIDNRFDMVVARVSGGTATLVAIPGTNSATNPTLPKSKSIATSFNSASNIDFSTDVVLAALYRTGSGVITASRITDKRTMKSFSVGDQGAVAPAPGRANTGPGSLYYQTNSANSGFWIEKADGTWIELAQNLGSSLPIGAMIMWPTTAALPSGCLEASGQLLSTTTYATLFGIYGYVHGGSGASFAMPNMHHRHPRGTNVTAEVGTVLGADSYTLVAANLPAHTHYMDHNHVHDHNHPMDHDHPNTTTTFAGSHRHDVLGQPNAGSPPRGLGQQYNSGSSGATFYAPSAQYNIITSQDGNQLMTDTHAGHSHSFDVPNYTGYTAFGYPNSTGYSSNVNTGATGGGTSFSTIPASLYTRYIVRASVG